MTSRRPRCIHRYKGLYGRYQPYLRHTKDGYIITEYKCQIIGCGHWEPHFKSKCTITYHKHNRQAKK